MRIILPLSDMIANPVPRMGMGANKLLPMRIVASGEGSVGDEGGLVGDHAIRCASIGNEETCARPKLVGHECN